MPEHYHNINIKDLRKICDTLILLKRLEMRIRICEAYLVSDYTGSRVNAETWINEMSSKIEKEIIVDD